MHWCSFEATFTSGSCALFNYNEMEMGELNLQNGGRMPLFSYIPFPNREILKAHGSYTQCSSFDHRSFYDLFFFFIQVEALV